MRFKVKEKPDLLDKKTVIRFAYFPTRINDNIVWLEKYECVYIWYRDSFWGYYYWKLIDKKLINN